MNIYLMRSLVAFVLASTILCGAFASSLAAADDEDESGGGLVVHQISPRDTDPKINTFTDEGFQHWTWYNSVAKDKGQLVIFLPGTGGKGKWSGKFNKAAAKWGYHVVSLAYPDSISISWFHDSDDRDAFEKARLNVITGSEPYAGLKVDQANSTENRLVKIVRYLAKTYPQEKWQQFLNANNTIEWDKTILAGQSQGGGHACFMAMKLHHVARVLMFGAPKDFNRHFNRPGKWFSCDSITPINRFFSFVHTDDEHNGCTYAQQLLIYQSMMLMPKYKVIDVDNAAPPYSNSRLLTSTFKQGDPHNAPLHDARYRQAWKYLLFEQVE